MSFRIPHSHLHQISNPSLNLHNFCCPKAISRPLLSDSAAETLICVFIISCLDSTDGVLFVIPNKALDKLQYVQNGQVPYFLYIPSCPCSIRSPPSLHCISDSCSSVKGPVFIPHNRRTCPPLRFAMPHLWTFSKKKQMKDVIY